MKLQKFFAHSLVLSLFAIPLIVSGAEVDARLVPCGGQPGTKFIDASGATLPADHPCEFTDMMLMVNKIISFILWDLLLPLMALAFMVIGGKLVLFQDKPKAISEAKSSLESMMIGIAIILSAFVGIKFFLAQFLNTDKGFTMFLLN